MVIVSGVLSYAVTWILLGRYYKSVEKEAERRYQEWKANKAAANV